MSLIHRHSMSRGAAGGFAYIWLLMAIAMLGLGLVAAADIYSTERKRDQERELISIGNQFRSAIGSYYESRPNGTKADYPPSLEDLLKDNRFPGLKRHLRRIFVDPFSGKPEWGVVLVGGRVVGIHPLSTCRPIKQSGFDDVNSSLQGKQHYSEWVFTYPADLLNRLPGGDVAKVPGPAASTGNMPSQGSGWGK